MEKIPEITRAKTRSITRLFVSLGILVLVLTIFPAGVKAATLYFSPSTGSFNVGQNFSVSIHVSSTGQAMNAISGVVSFPQDKLRITSLSQASSIISLWVQEPEFSNTGGTASFEGIVLNPGFTGSAGKIVTVHFSAKAAGNAIVSFASGAILANDGKGSNILTSLGTTAFALQVAGPPVPEAVTPPEAVGGPAAPPISSSTHPDPNKWYANNAPKFTWIVPPGTTGARLLVGRIPQALPFVTYIPAISSKALEDLTDGIWYFHVRLRNNAGWGGVFHFRFQIDTEKPSRFAIKKVPEADLTDPQAQFIFDAEDKTSGIDHYEVQIDGGSPDIWRDDGRGIYEAPPLDAGAHTLVARAVDKAGNALTESVDFHIESLVPPTIVEYSRELESDEIFTVRGTTYPNAQVTLVLRRDREIVESKTIRSDQAGNFTFTADRKLAGGVYTLLAEVVDKRGARSGPSEEITTIVRAAPLFRVIDRILKLLVVVIPVAALIILLIVMLWYGWYRIARLKKKLRKEVYEAENSLHEAFDILKEDIREQIKTLEKAKTKRQLTREEERVIKRLKKDLTMAEKAIKKEIKDIEREIQ